MAFKKRIKVVTNTEGKAFEKAYIVFRKCWSELGRSLVYMDYFNEDIDDWGGQRERVAKLCRELTQNSASNDWRDVKYYTDLLDRIEDEVENQC